MSNIPFESIFFFVFAFIGIIFSILAVNVKSLIHSAVCLMVVLSTSAAYYVLLSAEFMAGVQILLYVGGVLILVVFAIMVTSSTELIQEKPRSTRKVTAAFASILFFATSVYVFCDDFFKVNKQHILKDEIASIGKIFLNYDSEGQIIAFELISIILLAALIGGVVVGRRDDEDNAKVEVNS